MRPPTHTYIHTYTQNYVYKNAYTKHVHKPSCIFNLRNVTDWRSKDQQSTCRKIIFVYVLLFRESQWSGTVKSFTARQFCGKRPFSPFKRKNRKKKKSKEKNLRYMRTESRVLMLLMFSDIEKERHTEANVRERDPVHEIPIFSCGTRFFCSVHRLIDATLKSVNLHLKMHKLLAF